jgi:hypothetical protein
MINVNRVVAVSVSVLALILGLLPVIANFDWTSTAGIIGSLTVILGIVYKWLGGWQEHEKQIAIMAPVLTPVDMGDPGELPPPTGRAATPGLCPGTARPSRD